MPKIVDHEERRNHFVRQYLLLVESNGIAAVSSRFLAESLGISHTLLWRYFSSMEELIATAHTTIVTDTNRRIAESITTIHGIEALRLMIKELLPLTPTSQAEANIVVNFWGLSVSINNTTGENLQELSSWAEQIMLLLKQAIASNEVRANTLCEDVAEMIMCCIVKAQIEYSVSGSHESSQRTYHTIMRYLHQFECT